MTAGIKNASDLMPIELRVSLLMSSSVTYPICKQVANDIAQKDTIIQICNRKCTSVENCAMLFRKGRFIVWLC